MFLGQVKDFEIHIWKEENGRYAPADEKEVAQPSFNPIIVFRKKWVSATSIPIVYDDHVLYFVYTDAITGEPIKERAELMGDGYQRLIEEAERALATHFSKGQNEC